MSIINIRDAHAGDVHIMLRLIKELAAYEKAEYAVKASETDLLRDGFGQNPRFYCRLAEMDGAVVGFTLWINNYSTWVGRSGIWLEDIFVTERARGKGVGRRLLVDLAYIARSQGVQRLDFSVLDWNPARQFYEKLGVRHMSDWRPYRLTAKEIDSLAKEAELSH